MSRSPESNPQARRGRDWNWLTKYKSCSFDAIGISNADFGMNCFFVCLFLSNEIVLFNEQGIGFADTCEMSIPGQVGLGM